MNLVEFGDQYKNLVENFTCGNIILDNFLKGKDALDPNIGVTYIMLSKCKKFIIGFCNISVSRIDFTQSVNGQDYLEPMGGAFHINYLGVHKNFQHKLKNIIEGKKIYIGDIILVECEEIILKANELVGASFITLYSTEEGQKLYNRNDYEAFEKDMVVATSESDSCCYKMYKCLEDIR